MVGVETTEGEGNREEDAKQDGRTSCERTLRGSEFQNCRRVVENREGVPLKGAVVI